MDQHFMELNRIPENVKKIHLVAACGTGMGALACMLKDSGFDVAGSDSQVYPPMSEFLADKGIRLFDGFSKDNLSYNPDLVIIGNAVTRANPESVEMMEKRLCFCSMPQAINGFFAEGKQSVMVTGTHGKTTTSSIIAWILYAAGLDPTYMIGGILKNFDSNYRLGKSNYIVLEGDEYDTAFFDKGPKFLHYNPLAAVVTGIEFDHADIFKDIEHIEKAFNAMASGMSPESRLFAWDGDNITAKVSTGKKCRVSFYGNKKESDWRFDNITIDPPLTIFDVFKDQKPYSRFKTSLVGRHNLANALAAIAVADSLGIDSEAISNALESFKGVRRRQEIRGTRRGITVMDDFAHHPTAVRETIKAVKPYYPKGRIVAVFEPRTNTSMRKVFQDKYPPTFDDADLICIRKPSRLDKIPEDERFSSEKLASDIRRRGKPAHHFNDTDSIIEFLCNETRSGDLILVMSNGGFDNIHKRLLDVL